MVADTANRYEAFPVAIPSASGGSILTVYQDNENHYGGTTSVSYFRQVVRSGLNWVPQGRVRLVPASLTNRWSAIGIVRRGNRVAVLTLRDGPRRGYIQVTQNLASWPTPTQIDYGNAATTWTFPCHLAWVEDGSANGLMLATAYGGGSGGPEGVMISASHDNGATWARWSTPSPKDEGWSETTICQLLSGELLMMQRKDTGPDMDVLHIRRSTDYGKTWSPPVPVIRQASGMPNMTVLDSGVVIATVRDLAGPARESWSLGVSHDQGQTWQKIPVSAEWMMYGSVVQLDDRSLVLVGSSQRRDSNINASVWAKPLRVIPIQQAA